MAEVLKARDLTGPADAIVAVKRILPHLTSDKQYVAMFLDESRVLAGLRHDSIIRTLEVGQVGETPFIALEYVWGQDARALFHRSRRTQRPIPIRIACYVMAQVCAALEYAHAQRDSAGRPLGIVHRDVSLQNILISYAGAVKLSDFGIAASSGNTVRTQAGVVKGNLGYMSPEQLNGESVDRRSDIFAAGICAYELLTSERLFAGATDYASITKLRYGAVEPPSRHNRDIPLSLEELVMRALSKRADDRFQTAGEMRDALRSFMAEASNACSADDLAAHMRSVFAAALSKRPTPQTPRSPLSSSQLGDELTDPENQELESVSEITDSSDTSTTSDSGDATTTARHPNSDAPWGDSAASDVFVRTGLPLASYGPTAEGDDDDLQSSDARDETTNSGTWNRAPTSGVQPAAIFARGNLRALPGHRRSQEPARASAGPMRRGLVAARAPIAYGAVMATVAGIIAVIVAALYVNYRMRPAEIRLQTTPDDAEVRVDARRIPSEGSQFVIREVAPDAPHLVEVRKHGYKTWSTRLELRSGQLLLLPRVILMRTAAAKPGISEAH